MVAAIGLLSALPAAAATDIVISQYYEGTSFNKIIELHNPTGGNITMDGYRLTLWTNAATENWKNGTSTPNTNLDLSGVTIPAGGYYLVAHGSAALPAYAITGLPSAQLSSSVINFNGDDSIVLYRSSTYTVENILDAVSFTDAGNEGIDKSFYRLTNDVGWNTTAGTTVLTFPAVWGTKDLATVAGALDSDPWYLKNGGGGGPVDPPLTLVVDAATVNELAPGNTVTGRVTIATAAAAEITVTLTSSDTGEATVTGTVTIPAGAVTSGNFTITGVDDESVDGPQTVNLRATAPGYSNSSGSIQVLDNGIAPALTINEFFSRGDVDTNGDGADVRQHDEFVEIVNTTAQPVDMSGYTLSDSFGVTHSFPQGTILNGFCSIVVFGGGDIKEGRTAAFGSAWVQKSNRGSTGLSLNDGGDTITLRTAEGAVVRAETYGAEANVALKSLARSPDGAVGPYVSGTPTPGARGDGFPFCNFSTSLTATLSTPTATEGASGVTLTVTRPSPYTSEITVLFSGTSSTTVSLPATLTIPAGAPSAQVDVTVIDDLRDEANAPVVIQAITAGHLNGEASLQIVDNDATLPVAATVFINEVNADTPTSGTTEPDEFIELYTPEGARSLDGYILVLFNGGSATFASYDIAIDLTGYQTNAAGFFTVGDPAAGITMPVAGFTLQNGPDGIALYKTPEVLPDIWPPTIPRSENLHNGQVIVHTTGVTPGTNGLTDAFGVTGLSVILEQAANAPVDLSVSRLGDGGALLVSQAPTPNATNGAAPDGYRDWALAAGITGDRLADFDGDGIANIVEYVTGSNPSVTSPPPVSVTYLSLFQFYAGTVSKGPGWSDPNLKVEMQGSTDLLTWSAQDLQAEETETTFTGFYLFSLPSYFYRLRVTPL